MGVHRRSLVCKVNRGGKLRLVIDFSYLDKAGRKHRYRRDATVQTAAAARAEAERLFSLAMSPGGLEARPSMPTLAAFVEGTFTAMCLPKYRPATRVRYEALLRQGLLEAFGSKRLDEIGPIDITGYVASLIKRGVQARGHVNFLRTILRAAVDLRVLEAMPPFPKGLRAGRKLPDAPSDADVRTMLAQSHGWLRVAIALAAFAGLRMGEVRALEVRDVDLVNEQLHVRRALSEGEVPSPKSGDERSVPLLPELGEYLVDALKSEPPAARVVLNGRRRTPSRQHVLTVLKNLEKQHGIRTWSFHSLRHYFCSRLVRGGGSVEAVRVLAGHSSLAVTSRYVHATRGDLREAIAKLSVGSAGN